ncbi:CBASS cGAMP-activated phospholipase [Pseudonocardia alni]|uniref:CBASS cGAMP-activated phospholipase n=1 Tax=Pseudonocardia alni TaxID=33907 RepID=UPI00372322DA
MNVPDSRFQILSLDGGGLRGIFGAAVLARLEEDLDIRVVDHFDLIAGTSTGGIIALGLGLGLTPRQIVEFYTKHGPRIFRDRARIRGARHFLRAKYSSEPLRDALVSVFGDRRFGESTKRLVIPSYNLGDDDVYLFRTPHLERLARDWRELAVDVAMATTAAPTYLPALRLGGVRLVDGGIWASNPSLVAMVEAAGPLGVPHEAIHVLSLGTTTDVRHRPPRLDRGGLLPWATDAVEVLMRAQSASVTKQLGHLLTRDRVFRLDSTVPTGLLSLDRVDADDLVGRAAHASRIASPDVAERFTDHIAAPYTPLHPRKEPS